MITISSSGSFKNTDKFLAAMQRLNIRHILEGLAKEGVDALARTTPVDSGRTAVSWDYEVNEKGGIYEVIWTNSHMENGFPVAIMLQYGHGTGTGGYVQGRDYINPAIQPVFDRISIEVWKAVTSA